MFRLLFREAFGKSLSKLRDKEARGRVLGKIEELKERAPLGKKLFGYSYWSIHVGRLRVIYEMRRERGEIEIIELLERKRKYRELKRLK